MKLLGLLLFIFCLTGCGYNFPGQSGNLPTGVERVYIPLFANKTTEPQLENELTNRVSEVFSRNKSIAQVKKITQADAILTGIISDYSTHAVAYDRNDDIGEYKATMIVAVSLVATDTNDILWDKTISWSRSYNAADDKGMQEDFEQQAIDEISLRLAEEILYRLLDDF